MIKCAKCKLYHPTTGDVRKCFQGHAVESFAEKPLVAAGASLGTSSLRRDAKFGFGLDGDPSADAGGHDHDRDYIDPIEAMESDQARRINPNRMGGNPSGQNFLGVEPEPMASAKQVKFITDLLKQKVHDEGDLDPQTVTKRDASALIGKLLKCENLPKSQQSKTMVEPGLYEDGDNNIWLVYDSNYVDARLAKRLMLEDMPDAEEVKRLSAAGIKPKIGWTRGTKAPVFQLRPEMAVTKVRAVELGKAFGFCMRCGALLEDPNSIAAGIGPKCATYF